MLEPRDIPGFGVRLVGPGDPRFVRLAKDIMDRPQPFPSFPVDDLSNAAVLL